MKNLNSFNRWLQSTQADFENISSQILNDITTRKQIIYSYSKTFGYDFFIPLREASLFYTIGDKPNIILKKLIEKCLKKCIHLNSYQHRTMKKDRKSFRAIISSKINMHIQETNQRPKTPSIPFRPYQPLNKIKIIEIINEALVESNLNYIRNDIVNIDLVYGFFHQNVKDAHLQEDPIIPLILKYISK